MTGVTPNVRSLTSLANHADFLAILIRPCVLLTATSTTGSFRTCLLERVPKLTRAHRVRYISEALGLTPIIWTTVDGNSYDTEDWRVTAGVAPAQVVLDEFEAIINASTTLDTGFIVLAHDLHPTTVDLAGSFFRSSFLSLSLTRLRSRACPPPGNGFHPRPHSSTHHHLPRSGLEPGVHGDVRAGPDAHRVRKRHDDAGRHEGREACRRGGRDDKSAERVGGRKAGVGKMGSFGGAWGGDVVDLAWFSSD